MEASLVEAPEALVADSLHQRAWYAVYTRSRHEQVVYSQLASKGQHVFLPKMKTWSRRTDRRLRIEVPMFPGYLFVQTSLHPALHLSILRTVGVVSLVHFQGRPARVSPEEIISLQILMDSGATIHPAENFGVGDLVHIVEGPFKGVAGRLVERRSTKRLVVAVETINRAVYVEIDDHLVRKAEII